MDRAKSFKSGLIPPITFTDEESPRESEADTIVPELDNLTLETDAGTQPLQLQTNEVLTAGESNNAQMAIDNSLVKAFKGKSTKNDGQDFPFPSQDGVVDGEIKEEKSGKRNNGSTKQSSFDRPTGDLTRKESRRPPLVSRMTEPLTNGPFRSLSAFTDYAETYAVRPPESLAAAKRDLLPDETIATLTTSNMALHNREPSSSSTPPGPPPAREKRPPRLLLVDDNKINLRLLETYMRKRKYKYVDSAENGQLAVQAAETHQHGYDIIFMGEFRYAIFNV